MLKVFIILKNYAHLPVLYPNLGFVEKKKSLFFNEAFRYYTAPVFSIVNDPAVADYFLIPHEFYFFRNDAGYLQAHVDLSKKYQKEILIFTHSDYDQEIKLPNAIVFRISQYGYKKKANEILMPPYAEDLLGSAPLSIRHKQPEKLVIGFCGWANLTNMRDKVGYYVKLSTHVAKQFLTGNQQMAVRRSGIWFRKKALKVLQKSSRVRTNFLIRDSFSGHRFTMKLDPIIARQEYISNMLNSDLALAVKGGGNNSLRFYEALSLGRVPLLLDTDCILPLADIINYKEFVLFVDFRELDKIDVIAADFYQKLSAEDWLEMQTKARAAFVNYLRIDSFFKQIPGILKKFHD